VSKKILNENIIIAPIKNVKQPNNLELINIKTFKKTLYRSIDNNFSIKFFVYAFNDCDENYIIKKIKGAISV